MKKFVGIIVAAVIAISNASAIGLGVTAGGGVAKFKLLNDDNLSAWGGAVDFRLTLPHTYGSSNWYGQGEVGYTTPIFFDVGYVVGYHFHLGGNDILLSPFVGIDIPSFMSFGVNAGVELRIPLGIGDLSVDLRYNPSWGIISRSPSFMGNIGYVFLFGKDKR